MLRLIAARSSSAEGLTSALNSEKEIDLQGQEVDEDAFIQKLEKAIATLDSVPVEKQRAIFTSLIKFIEIKPMRIKMGLYAPTKSSNRTGSMSVGNGAPGRT